MAEEYKDSFTMRQDFIKKCLGAKAVTIEFDGGIGKGKVPVDGAGQASLSAEGFEYELRLIRDILAAQKLEGSDTLKVVNLSWNTPGGETLNTDAIIEQLKAFEEENPDICVIMHGNLVASAGLRIAVACDKVYLRPEGKIGSLGAQMLIPKFPEPELFISTTDGKNQITDLDESLTRKNLMLWHEMFFRAVADYLTKKGTQVDLQALQTIRDEVVAAQKEAETYALSVAEAYTASQKQGTQFIAPELPPALADMPSIQQYLKEIEQRSSLIGPDGKSMLSSDMIQLDKLAKALRLKAEKDIVMRHDDNTVLWYVFLYSSGVLEAQEALKLGMIDGILDTAGYEKMLDEHFDISPERILKRTIVSGGVLTEFPVMPQPVAANDNNETQLLQNNVA